MNCFCWMFVEAGREDSVPVSHPSGILAALLVASAAAIAFFLEYAREQVWHPVIVIWVIAAIAVTSTIALLWLRSGPKYALPANIITNALLAADVRMQLYPDQAEQIYDQTAARWNRGEATEIVDLARWLNFHQKADRVLSLFSIERAVGNNQLLLARLDALATLQRWNDISALLVTLPRSR